MSTRSFPLEGDVVVPHHGLPGANPWVVTRVGRYRCTIRKAPTEEYPKGQVRQMYCGRFGDWHIGGRGVRFTFDLRVPEDMPAVGDTAVITGPSMAGTWKVTGISLDAVNLSSLSEPGTSGGISIRDGEWYMDEGCIVTFSGPAPELPADLVEAEAELARIRRKIEDNPNAPMIWDLREQNLTQFVNDRRAELGLSPEPDDRNTVEEYALGVSAADGEAVIQPGDVNEGEAPFSPTVVRRGRR